MWTQELFGLPARALFRSHFSAERDSRVRAVYLKENDEGLELRAEVPGLTPDELEVSLEGRVLTLEGAREVETPEGFEALHQERTAYRISHRIRLPFRVDGERIVATIENGMLRMAIPRASEEGPQKIPVVRA